MPEGVWPRLTVMMANVSGQESGYLKLLPLARC